MGIELKLGICTNRIEIVAKSNSEIEVVYRAYDIHLKEPTYFKPGLPIELKVQQVLYIDKKKQSNQLFLNRLSFKFNPLMALIWQTS